MKNINLVYEYEFDDVDIIAVPDEVADNITNIVQQFNDWMWYNLDKHSFFELLPSGKKILSTGTEAFIWWLNTHFIQTNETAHLIQEHCNFDPALPWADF